MGWDHFIFYINSQAYYSVLIPPGFVAAPDLAALAANRVFLLALQPRVKKDPRDSEVAT